MPIDAEAQNRIAMVERNQRAILEARKSSLPSLESIANNIKAQDNRGTANPVFMVEQLKRIYGVNREWTDTFVWMNDEGDEAGADMVDAFEAKHSKDGSCHVGDYHRVGYKEYWEAVQPFFTKEAADQYIRRNGHNLDKTRVYVYGGYRNDEWAAIREHLLSLPTEAA